MTELQINQLFQKFEEGRLNDNELVCFVELIKALQQNQTENHTDCINSKQKSAKALANIISYFQNEENMIKVKKAQSIIFREPEALKIFDKHQFDRIHYMPSNTKAQKAKKRALKAELNMLYRSSKLIKKSFPDGIREPDEKELINALNMPETNRAEKAEKKRAVKSAQKRKKMFYNAAKPYVEAKMLISKYNEYNNWKKLEVRYNELRGNAEA